jgi:hypothetical protein
MKTCKNCANQFEGNFCNQCGQKDFEPPFDVKDFFYSDVKNEAIGFDNGFVYTVKKLLFKPGVTIYQFINGKRVNFIQPFSFVLIALAFTELINKYSNASEFYPAIEKENFITKTLNYLVNDPKWLMVLIIPLISKISHLIFKKYNIKFGDHFLFNIYALSMLNIIQGLCMVPMIFTEKPSIFKMSTMAYGILALLYYFIIVYQYFAHVNSEKSSTLIRALATTVISFLLIVIVFTILAVLENIAG